MHYFKAINDKQLGVCLRMLFADDIRYFVETKMNDKGKIEFLIGVDVSQSKFEMLRKRYEILIS